MYRNDDLANSEHVQRNTQEQEHVSQGVGLQRSVDTFLSVVGLITRDIAPRTRRVLEGNTPAVHDCHHAGATIADLQECDTPIPSGPRPAKLQRKPNQPTIRTPRMLKQCNYKSALATRSSNLLSTTYVIRARISARPISTCLVSAMTSRLDTYATKQVFRPSCWRGPLKGSP